MTACRHEAQCRGPGVQTGKDDVVSCQQLCADAIEAAGWQEASSSEAMPSAWLRRKIYLTVMRVRTEDGSEYTGVFLPYQVAESVLDALRAAEPELAKVKVAGGEPHIDVNLHPTWGVFLHVPNCRKRLKKLRCTTGMPWSPPLVRCKACIR